MNTKRLNHTKIINRLQKVFSLEIKYKNSRETVFYRNGIEAGSIYLAQKSNRKPYTVFLSFGPGFAFIADKLIAEYALQHENLNPKPYVWINDLKRKQIIKLI